MGCSLPEIVPIVVMGIFIWTFFEYVLHRFVFHIKTKSYWLVTFSLSLCYIS